jgi:hypothetical protein
MKKAAEKVFMSNASKSRVKNRKTTQEWLRTQWTTAPSRNKNGF